MWRECSKVATTATTSFANCIVIEGLQVAEMLELQRFENGFIFRGTTYCIKYAEANDMCNERIAQRECRESEARTVLCSFG